VTSQSNASSRTIHSDICGLHHQNPGKEQHGLMAEDPIIQRLFLHETIFHPRLYFWAAAVNCIN
ncbi:TPA: hypothetical protein ACWP5B_005031, partial [Escherichia coli]